MFPEKFFTSVYRKRSLARLISFLTQLNPANWFNDFRNVEISIDEEFIQRSRWGN